jgi:hypothetical protein
MRGFVAALCATALGWIGAAAIGHAQDLPRGSWNSFAGSWSAVGRRQTLPTETGRPAGIIELSGTLVVTREGASAAFPSGFRAKAIGFDDGDQPGVGRAVWTDSRGDLIFSALRAERFGTGRRVTGTITGGTGRYAGLAGDWNLTWQFVVETEDGDLQGRAVDLRGRFRLAEPRP